MKAVQKLKSKNYSLVIQINVPVRFYWVGDKYDGLEFGPIPSETSKYQHKLMRKLLLRLPNSNISEEKIIEKHLRNRESAIKEAQSIINQEK